MGRRLCGRCGRTLPDGDLARRWCSRACKRYVAKHGGPSAVADYLASNAIQLRAAVKVGGGPRTWLEEARSMSERAQILRHLTEEDAP